MFPKLITHPKGDSRAWNDIIRARSHAIHNIHAKNVCSEAKFSSWCRDRAKIEWPRRIYCLLTNRMKNLVSLTWYLKNNISSSAQGNVIAGGRLADGLGMPRRGLEESLNARDKYYRFEFELLILEPAYVNQIARKLKVQPSQIRC